MRLGFVVNPIAGMGGRVGLKGTDNVYLEAIKRGAKPVAPQRTYRFLNRLSIYDLDIEFLTASSIMGEDYLSNTDYRYHVVGKIDIPTTREDTIAFVEKVKKKIDILVFVGGDGTARDIYSVLDEEKPVIGVPSGVKMFSGVFTITPEKAADLLKAYIDGEAILDRVEILDIDEERYREGKLITRLYGYMITPYLPGVIQGSKKATPLTEAKEEIMSIARFIVDNMDKYTLYILGPGYTVKSIMNLLNLKHTTLGVDLVFNGKLVGLDVDEKEILRQLDKYNRAKIIISPIGGQGIIFGRGNQVISPEVIKRVGIPNVIIISPIWKLRNIPCLYLDTGDPSLDNDFPDYVKVVVRYGEYKVIKICK